MKDIQVESQEVRFYVTSLLTHKCPRCALTLRFGSPFDHDPEHPQDGAHEAAEEQPIVLWDGRSSGEVGSYRHHSCVNPHTLLLLPRLLLSSPFKHVIETPSLQFIMQSPLSKTRTRMEAGKAARILSLLARALLM